MAQTYRKGGIGALMDEYERAAAGLTRILSDLTDAEYERIRDRRTQDEHCRSIQTIMSHVVNSGYGYADYIRKVYAIESRRPPFETLSRREAPERLARMLAYTAETLEGRWEYSDEQIVAVQMRVSWGPTYDLEQLLEHAIVHILRHRRQIERFLTEEQFTRGV
jgi:uncharacterized damage-inducible protein DinB